MCEGCGGGWQIRGEEISGREWEEENLDLKYLGFLLLCRYANVSVGTIEEEKGEFIQYALLFDGIARTFFVKIRRLSTFCVKIFEKYLQKFRRFSQCKYFFLIIKINTTT